METSNKKAWGIVLILFGVIFFLKTVGLFGENCELYNIKNFPVYAGLVFLATRNFKVGVLLCGIGALLRLDQIIELTKDMSQFIWPLLLVLAGALLFFSKNNKNESKYNQTHLLCLYNHIPMNVLCLFHKALI